MGLYVPGVDTTAENGATHVRFLHFHDIYDGFCSWSLVCSRLSSLGPLTTSPALRGKSRHNERGRGIYSPRLDSARWWSEHYFSEQAFARFLLLPLLHATRGNPSTYMVVFVLIMVSDHLGVVLSFVTTD